MYKKITSSDLNRKKLIVHLRTLKKRQILVQTKNSNNLVCQLFNN